MKRADSTDTCTASSDSTRSSSTRLRRSRAGPRNALPDRAGAGGRSPRSSSGSSPPTPPTPLDTASAAASNSPSAEPKESLSHDLVGALPGARVPASASNASPDAAASSGSAPASASLSPPAPVSLSQPRIVYGPGTVARLPIELGRLQLCTPLIVSSPSRVALARRVQALVPNLDSRILDSAVVNVPGRVIDDALNRISGRDVVISIGGASAVGLAKAIGGRKGIPHICIPTTYSGSEMMPLLLDASPARHSSRRHATGTGRRRSGSHTTTVRDPRILPTVIIYDEELTTSPPKRVSAPSDSVAMARSTESRVDGSNDDSSVELYPSARRLVCRPDPWLLSLLRSVHIPHTDGAPREPDEGAHYITKRNALLFESLRFLQAAI